MTLQIKPSVTNPTIADVYKDIADGRLVLRPDFQRKFVWTHEHQEAFLDTIMKGLPFPEIYVCEGTVDVANLRTTKHVIDGQQRLTTIRRYIDGEHDHLGHLRPYAHLDDSEKQKFVTYQLVMRDIGRVDDETVREIFRRINLTKFKLEDVEIHNAVYDGQFIQAAKTVLDSASLISYGVFRDSEFTRMADLHFVLLVMATIENGGYFAQDREVEPKVAGLNEEYPNREAMIALLLKTFDVINELNLPLDSIWFRKSNFFTLVVELATHLEELPSDLSDRLGTLEERILANRGDQKNEYGQYYSYMYQATHGRKARVVRADVFRRDVLGLTEQQLAFVSAG
jgi:hypothetical protein